MPTKIQRNAGFWTPQRAVIALALLLAAGVLLTPVQWYAAYVGVQREKRRWQGRPRATSDNARATARTRSPALV